MCLRPRVADGHSSSPRYMQCFCYCSCRGCCWSVTSTLSWCPTWSRVFHTSHKRSVSTVGNGSILATEVCCVCCSVQCCFVIELRVERRWPWEVYLVSGVSVSVVARGVRWESCELWVSEWVSECERVRASECELDKTVRASYWSPKLWESPER